MLTYVINTSENKTFDSSLLFELAGYNKIRWMRCPLDKVEKCAEEICEKQNILGADHFRIAVIVDFFGFDRIRIPYGRRGFRDDTGVDVSIYVPYIEAFLLDNLVVYLEKRDLFAADFEVYYVQNEKSENYDLFENAKRQLEQVLEGLEKAKPDEDAPLCDCCSEACKDECFGDGVARCAGQRGMVQQTVFAKCIDKFENISKEEDVAYTEDMAEKLLGTKNKKGKYVKLTLCSDLHVGDTVEVLSTKKAGQTFTITELYSQDGTPIDVATKATANFFAYVPEDIVIKNEDVLCRCEPLYTSFRMYCTPTVQLDFNLCDYPYGATEMTFTDFWHAFKQRSVMKTDLRRHYYLTMYGGGASRAALDTLSLCLYLIRTFEREETILSEGNMEVIHLDSTTLKDVLETAWSKVNAAKVVSKRNNMNYYSLAQLPLDMVPEEEVLPEEAEADGIARERNALPKEVTESTMSPDKLYEEIGTFFNRKQGEVEYRNRAEFDKIMGDYLRRRDDTRAADVEAEFAELKAAGFLKTTAQCPSKEEYEYAVEKKEKEISEIFQKALGAEYIKVDYTEEKKAADNAYMEYKRAKACMQRSLLGDLIFMVMAIVAMLIPYSVLQLSSYKSTAISSTLLGFAATGIFAGLFLLAVAIQFIPQAQKLRAAKRKLLSTYVNCCAKERYSFSSIRRRYEKELISIEQARYEIRQLKSLYTANREKERYIAMHHEMLEKLEDCLGSILNNLDVEPTADRVESVEGEFDLNKPFRARENSVYHIFSIETIEKMFPKKGRDEQ